MLKFFKISVISLALILSLTYSSAAQVYLVGDLNEDQRVDLEDIRILGRQWLDPDCLVSACTANLDGTNGINMADFALLAMNWAIGPKVVINEIHYDPVIKTDLAEFIELYNTGTMDANISDWYFSDGISYQFPLDTIIPVGGYVVVAQDPYTIQTKFGTPPNLIYGPFDLGFKLENTGEKVELRNAEGRIMDEVDYRCRFPWPIVGDPPGNSAELANPAFDNDLGGSWRPSEPEAVAPPTTFITAGATWRYFKGYSEASSPTSAWRQIGFDDSLWSMGQVPIGYGEYFIVTNLYDMQGGYSSVFLRKRFNVANAAIIKNLKLFVIYDDGFNVWINGKSVLPPINVADENMPFNGTAAVAREDQGWNEFNLSPPSQYLVDGNNVLAIQLFNASLSTSTDCFLDVELKNAPASTTAGPTPGKRNATYSTNIAPQMRQVNHEPKQPKSSDDVRITVKVTDTDGVKSVILSYQLVYPGSYIELNDPEYETNWTDIPMVDNGTAGDLIAGDNIYTVVIPSSLHSHRLLVRYRITAKDNIGLSVTGPYAHDPQPNFAYFVYDGVPAWYGAIDPYTPGKSDNTALQQVLPYTSNILTRIPVYHLITKKESTEHATWFDKYGGDLYKWYGTLVYDGDVYDHIRYRARGGVWRYAMGKNMWKFDFNRGHFFQARDDYGKKYDTIWDKLNLSACIQQGSFGQRGEQGMFEALTFRMFNLAGVPAPKTHYIHFRIIDEPYEDGNYNAAHPGQTTGGTQYDGDFWGLYLVIEQMDGRFLDEHGLPDGNLYKMEARYGELNNQGLTAVTDGSDIREFKDTYENTSTPANWWGENVNLDCYYSYRAVYLAAHHGDITSKNHFFYLNPELTTNEWGTNYLWWQLPWDVDLTWTTYYGSMSDPFSRTGFLGRFAIFDIASKNRIREVSDLLFNSEQMNQLIDEYAAIIDPPTDYYSMADADRAMWDYHWVVDNNAYPVYLSHTASFKAGIGRFYEEAEERGYGRSFPGMVQVMKGYVANERMSYMDSMAADYDIPYTPTVTALCAPDYPINDLRFVTSAFSDPQGGGFAAMKWRIAEVTDVTCPTYDPTDRKKYEIETLWETDEIKDFNSTITIPATVVKVGHAYRVRVKMKDNTGRWSHWSNKIHFIAGEPLSAYVLENLRVTEVMYNPAPPSPADTNDNDEFEFIELKNIGSTTIDLTYVSFTKGITFDFNDSNVIILEPNHFVLVVRNQAAFESRYGTSLSGKIAGEYRYNIQNNLSNGGETIKLEDYWNGTIIEFEYNDGRGWPLSADGGGHSLVPLDSAVANEPNGTLYYSGNWRPSTYIGGSPGEDDPPFVTTVVLNEIMANTVYSDPLHTEYDSNDWIELYNTSGANINLGNWYLSDTIDDLRKWPIPGTIIPAHHRISFDEVTGFHNPITSGFGLNNEGEQAVLSYLPGTSQDRIVDCIEFKGQESNISLGRCPDGSTYWFRLTPSRDSANTNPIPDILFEEIMYHPDNNEEYTYDDEYIELYNPTSEKIYLQSDIGPWRLNGAVNYTFYLGASIPPDDRIVIVPFHPLLELDRYNDFIFKYETFTLTYGVNLFGPWSGNLSNESERIALEKPVLPEKPYDPIYWVILDEVTYSDHNPWPETPDGTGDSLRRINSDQYHSGNDPQNWKADIPSPGDPNWTPPPPPPPP